MQLVDKSEHPVVVLGRIEIVNILILDIKRINPGFLSGIPGFSYDTKNESDQKDHSRTK